MDVVLLTPDREKAWKSFVEGSSDATLAHLLGWRNVVARTYHHTPYYLMAIDGQAIAGVLPLFLIRSPVFGRFLSTAPYLSHGGLLTADERAAHALVQGAGEVALEHKAKYVEIRGSSKVGHGLLLKDKYCTFLLPLASDPEVLWRNVEARARKAVRKARKSNLVIVHGGHLVGPFARVIGQHMRDLGTPFHRVSFYRHIVAEFPNQSEILMVCRAGQYLGGVLLVTFQETILPLYGGVLTAYRGFSPMSLLIWETIRYGCDRSLACIDFGRSRWESGTALFKRQWGARPVPLFYEYHVADGVTMPDMDPTNPRFHFARAVWKRLPLFVAKTLGPLIISDIP